MVRPKKHLGQHFLRDENIAQKIVGYLNPQIPLVLEVGPGTGVLSKYLLSCNIGACPDDTKPTCPVATIDPWFMEVDRESVEYLEKQYPEIRGRLIQADFLRYDLDRFPPTGEQFPASPPFSVIGNFPYNISSQILFKAIEHRNRIPEVIGMFQKEVAERIASPPGSKAYGIISVLLQAYYDIEYLFTVSETVFYPPPRVKSAVIRLRRNATTKLGCDEVLFVRLVKTAFNQRRKTLRNALRPVLASYPVPAGTATPTEWFTRCLDLRAEQLSVDDFVKLAAEISTFA